MYFGFVHWTFLGSIGKSPFLENQHINITILVNTKIGELRAYHSWYKSKK
jgi:hypothetical protein